MPPVRLKPRRCESPWLEMPSFRLNWTPWKSLRNLKLTTPPMASEPYTVEAPSASTSTLSIMLCGIMLTSGLAMRWPSISTRVRSMPRPRSEMREAPPPASSEGLAMPPPLLLFCGLVALPEMLGSACSTLPIVGLPALVIAARSTVTTGLAVSASTRRISEPVTTTALRVFAFSGVADCAEVCWAVARGRILRVDGAGCRAQAHAQRQLHGQRQVIQVVFHVCAPPKVQRSAVRFLCATLDAEPHPEMPGEAPPCSTWPW